MLSAAEAAVVAATLLRDSTLTQALALVIGLLIFFFFPIPFIKEDQVWFYSHGKNLSSRFSLAQGHANCPALCHSRGFRNLDNLDNPRT